MQPTPHPQAGNPNTNFLRIFHFEFLLSPLLFMIPIQSSQITAIPGINDPPSKSRPANPHLQFNVKRVPSEILLEIINRSFYARSRGAIATSKIPCRFSICHVFLPRH
jgi:hypothetical protein